MIERERCDVWRGTPGKKGAGVRSRPPAPRRPTSWSARRTSMPG